jgi:hypothetical protein
MVAVALAALVVKPAEWLLLLPVVMLGVTLALV